MALRKIATFPAVGATVTVYRDAEWQEYRVRVTLPGVVKMGDTDYHTDDKADALSTAAYAVAQHGGPVQM